MYAGFFDRIFSSFIVVNYGSLSLSSLIWDNWDNPVLSYLLQGEPGSPGTPGVDGEQVYFV